MKLLIVTNLFPSRAEPGRGLFNKQQFLELAKRCELKVVAPVPWGPRGVGLSRRGHALSEIPDRETLDGIDVFHPRYLAVPVVGRWLHGWCLYLGVRSTIRHLRRTFPFDRILATWAYPDVFGAALIARDWRVPLIAKVHGSDIHLATRSWWRRRMIVWALRRSLKVIAVSLALKERLLQLGLEAQRIHVIPNGVDVSVFRPMDRGGARRALSLPADQRRVVFVGNLAPVKGLATLIEAVRQLPDDVCLSIVGGGTLRGTLEATVRAQGLSDRVGFAGSRPHTEIPLWMNAADVVCLPSVSEGCPNVVVEALACGRPVVATRVGGIPELLTHQAHGILVPPQDSEALAEGLRRSLITRWDAAQIQGAVAGHGWTGTAERITQVLNDAGGGVNGGVDG